MFEHLDSDPELNAAFAEGYQAGNTIGKLLDGKKFAILASVWSEDIKEPRVVGVFSARGVNETAALARQVANALEDLTNPEA